MILQNERVVFIFRVPTVARGISEAIARPEVCTLDENSLSNLIACSRSGGRAVWSNKVEG